MCNRGFQCFKGTVFWNCFNIAVQTAAKTKGLSYISHTNRETVMAIISKISYLFRDNSEIQ